MENCIVLCYEDVGTLPLKSNRLKTRKSMPESGAVREMCSYLIRIFKYMSGNERMLILKRGLRLGNVNCDSDFQTASIRIYDDDMVCDICGECKGKQTDVIRKCALCTQKYCKKCYKSCGISYKYRFNTNVLGCFICNDCGTCGYCGIDYEKELSYFCKKWLKGCHNSICSECISNYGNDIVCKWCIKTEQ